MPATASGPGKGPASRWWFICCPSRTTIACACAASAPTTNSRSPPRWSTCGRRGGDREFVVGRSEEHTSELQSQSNLVCRLLLEKKKKPQFQRLPLHKNQTSYIFVPDALVRPVQQRVCQYVRDRDVPGRCPSVRTGYTFRPSDRV